MEIDKTKEYIDGLYSDKLVDDQLFMLRKEAEEANIPIISKQVEAVLKVLIKIKKPKKILEVGAAVGYSTLVFALASPQSQIITIERDTARAQQARENFKRYNCQNQISLIEGDALDILPELTESFDLVFIDAAKGQYNRFFDFIYEQVRPAGLIVSDNVLYRGMIANPERLVRRQKTIFKRLRSYLSMLTSHSNLETAVLPVGEGLAISVKEEG